MRTIYISNSMFRSLGTCDTQAWLRTKGYAVSGQENKRARAGKDAHLAFEGWLNGLCADDAVALFRNAFKPYSDQFLLDKDIYHVDNLSKVLTVFFCANPLPAMNFEVVETEKQVELEILRSGDTRYVVTDKSDGIVRMKDTGDLMCIEHKTTGNIGPDYLRDYELDSQITTHVAAARANGKDVKGVILMTVRFNKLPDPLAVTPKTGKPRSCRIADHGLQRDCWTLHVEFQRFPLIRTQEDITDWYNNAASEICRYEKVLSDSLDWVSQQGLFGHCGRCDFIAFCKGHRRNLDSLVIREREEGILYSGIVEE